MAICLIGALVFASGLLFPICVLAILLQLILLSHDSSPQLWQILTLSLGILSAPSAALMLAALLQSVGLQERSRGLPLGYFAMLLCLYLGICSDIWPDFLLGMRTGSATAAAALALLVQLYNMALLSAAAVAFLLLIGLALVEFSMNWALSLGNQSPGISLTALRMPLLLLALAFCFEVVVRIFSDIFFP